jgi:carbonic anhydrase
MGSRALTVSLQAVVSFVLLSAPGYNYTVFAEDWKSRDATWCASMEQTPIDVMRASELSSYDQMPKDFFPDIELPSVVVSIASHHNRSVTFEFPATLSATVRYPKGGTFTALFGAYTSTGQAKPASPRKFAEGVSDNGGPNSPQGVQATLLDLHWHVPSEHSVNGRIYPAEAHFVHYVQRDNDPDW